MNTITDEDRKLAATLKSLTLEPTSDAYKSPPNNRWRLVVGIGISLLTAAFIIAGTVLQPEIRRLVDLGNFSDDASGKDQSTSSELARLPRDEPEGERTVVRQPVPTVREVAGSGVVVAPHATIIFSKYEGRIIRIAVEPGDPVRAGQVLVMLDDAGARFALERAETAKDAADLLLAARIIDLTQARASLDRIETLANRDAVSKQQLEETRTVWERASNAVAQARQEQTGAELAIRIAAEPLRELTVRAPFDGTVTRLDAHVGDTVLGRADSVRESQSLLTITDTTRLAIDVDVAETNIAALRPGLRGEAVLDGFPDRPFAVEILRLAPVASVEKGTITLRLSLANPPEGIRPNMAARIRIPLDTIINQAGDIPQ